MKTSRRRFLAQAGLGALGLSFALKNPHSKPFFKMSLAEWSLAPSLFTGKLTNMDFPAKAKNDFGIDAVEYVNQFFRDKAKDQSYLGELKRRTDDLGVRNVRIMVDAEGNLSDFDEAKRKEAVENHFKWVEAAGFLGCSDIRVNITGHIGGETDVGALTQAAVDGYGRLVEFGAEHDMGIIIENHGGLSSNGQWLAGLMWQINNPYAGTLPDFGNFCIERTAPTAQTVEAYMATVCVQEYDRYRGTAEIMPFAKGVSAKANRFDEHGNEPDIDFFRLMQIVKDARFDGYVGIEYEGGFAGARGVPGFLPDDDGIRATKLLLERVARELS